MIKYHLNYYYKNGIETGDFILTQLGRILDVEKVYFPPHVQRDYYELTVVTSGKGVITTNNVQTYVKEGDIYISLPTDIHEIKSLEGGLFEYDFLAIKPTKESIQSMLEKMAYSIYDPKKRVVRDRNINYLLNSAILEMQNQSEYYSENLSHVFSLICTSLYRCVFSSKSAERKDVENGKKKLCYKIMNYIDMNLFTIKNLKDIAKESNYNYNYLSSLFKSVTGKSISNYFSNKKLAISKQLLDEKELSPTEIALYLNYESYFSFSRMFKEKYGISPRNYQKGIN